MIRLGPIVIGWTREVDVLHDVVQAAWPVHQAIWFDQTHDYSELMPLDAELAEALSYAPIEDAPLGKPHIIEWQVSSQDVRWNSYEASVVLREGWEPFGVSAVPNTLDQNQFRLWLRRPARLPRRRDFEIKVQSAGWGGHQVHLHLTQGWTPFAVSDSFENHIIWFRRPA